MTNSNTLACALLLLLASGSGKMLAAEGVAAQADPVAARAMYVDAARAGARVVAVGERGHVWLADDGGAGRQARQVPVDAMLNAVSFVDAGHGWAVGHGGVIIHTDDGGERWVLQRQDRSVDQPLLSVFFRDRLNGFAAGLWSLLLVTRDGGASWQRITLPHPDGASRGDLNLLKIFPGPDGRLYIAAERGMVLTSNDDGRTWRYLATGAKASFWSGTATASGTLLVGGLGGKIMRSGDQGVSWSVVDAGTSASITRLQADGSGVMASAMDGKLLRSRDDGISWQTIAASDTALTTFASDGRGGTIRFSRAGMLK